MAGLTAGGGGHQLNGLRVQLPAGNKGPLSPRRSENTVTVIQGSLDRCIPMGHSSLSWEFPFIIFHCKALNHTQRCLIALCTT